MKDSPMSTHDIRQSPDAKPGFFYGYIVVAAAFFCKAVFFGIHTSFGVFLKPVLNEFGWTRATVSGAFSFAAIVQGLLGVFMGGMNDRLGPRIVLSLSSLLFGLGLLLMSQISSVWQLYLFYGLVIGAGLSGVWVPLMSTVARWFVDRRGLMSGIVLVGLSIGGLTVPPLATLLITTQDWRITYLILGSIALAITITAAQFLRRDPAQMGQTPYVNAVKTEPKSESGTEGFTIKEAVHLRQFWIFIVMLLCSGFCMMGVIVHIVPHATDLGFSAAIASSILVTMNGLGIAGRVGLGRAGDKIGNRQVFIISFFLMMGTFLGLVSAREMWQLYLLAAVFGVAHGGLGVVESPMAAELFGLRSHGLIYGVAVLAWTLGASLGPFLTGYIFDINGSYQIAFLVSAAVSFLGVISAAVLKPTEVSRDQD